MLGRNFKASLVAKRNLIISGGRYMAQTDYPQFAVRIPCKLALGWVEILFEARQTNALCLARRPPFCDVLKIPLEPAAGPGRFLSVFRIDGPVAALRHGSHASPRQF